MSTSTANNITGHKTPESKDLIFLVALVRGACVVIWTCGIVYSTYQLKLATDEFLPWQSSPVLNPGPLTSILGRGQDGTDIEWMNFTRTFFTKLIYWYLGYVVFSILVPGKVQPVISLTFALLYSTTTLNLLATLYLFMQPVLYWILAQFVQNKPVIWLVSFCLLYTLHLTDLKEVVFGFNSEAEYYFDIGLGWMYARCISFTFDRWQRKDNRSISALWSALNYCFYFPILFHGPLILYNRYEADILRHGREKNPNWRNSKVIFRSSAKILGLILLTETIIHYIYFKPLSLTLPVLSHVNLWCLCGVVYWLGQFFMLKYQVLYGSSTCIAQFDGVEMPPLPKCPAHIHRYSTLWKDFDRGLYNFLVQYTYIPTIKSLNSHNKLQCLPPEVKKLIASLFAFFYVFVWHGVWFPIFVWAFFNFVGITAEHVGRFLKRWSETILKVECEELFWDFVVEPIVTIPLAAMSILNSVAFSGSLEAAVICTRRLLWTDVGDSFAFMFLFCFTQIGVTVRTWRTFRAKLIPEKSAENKS